MAYRALSARDRTEEQLRSWLERKRVEPDAVEHAVAELIAAGGIDDERYAQRFSEDKRELERWGSERIERELRRRGVAAALIDAALADQDRGGELDAALGLLADRVPAVTGDRERDRAWRLLVRKGYEPELAYEAVRAHERLHEAA